MDHFRKLAVKHPWKRSDNVGILRRGLAGSQASRAFTCLVQFPSGRQGYSRSDFYKIILSGLCSLPFHGKNVGPTLAGGVGSFKSTLENSEDVLASDEYPDVGDKHTGKGTRRFIEGDIHRGEFVNGRLHGQGTVWARASTGEVSVVTGIFRGGLIWEGSGEVHWHNNIVEKGRWSSGALCGYGVRKYPDGTVFEGEFKKGCQSGAGVMTQPGGLKLTGTFFKNEVISGSGSVRRNNKDIHEGNWVNGHKHGSFKITRPSGEVFVGTFENGYLQSGSGVLERVNGRIEEGTWTDGVLNGPGKTTYAEGKVCEGMHKSGKLHGEGEERHPDGAILVGEFKNGKIWNGKGTKRIINVVEEAGTFVDGELSGEGYKKFKQGAEVELIGTFRRGKLHGKGVWKNRFGASLEGEFRNSVPIDAEGTFLHPSGIIEEGRFVDGALSGKGKRTYYNGRTLVGIFENGLIVNGEGTLFHHESGDCEDGTWVNGRLHGYCRIVRADGTTEEGMFREGCRVDT